jgi:hypothetical protein
MGANPSSASMDLKQNFAAELDARLLECKARMLGKCSGF